MKNVRRYLSLFVIMLLTAASAQAQDVNQLVIKKVNGMLGKTISVPIYLENTSEIYALQFDVKLPGSQWNSCKVFYDSTQVAANRRVDHIIQGQKSGGKHRFMLYSPTNKALKGNSGKLCDIVFNVPNELTDGETYDITLSNVVMSDRQGNDVFTNSIDGTLSLISYPDFEVSNLRVTNADIRPGGQMTLSFTVKNIGEQASTGGWKESFYLIGDDGSESFVGSNAFENAGIAPGGSVSRSVTVDLPEILGADGKISVKVAIKGNSDSGERPEAEWNNSAKADAGVTITKSMGLVMPDGAVRENYSGDIRLQIKRSGSRYISETFNLSCDKPDRLQVPETVTIGYGQSGASFYVRTIDNDVYNDEDSVVTITATADNYEAVTGRLIIVDNELPSFTLTSSQTELNEGDRFQLTITLPKAAKEDTEFNITSETTKRFDFPTTVTVPKGQKTAVIDVEALQNVTPELQVSTAFYATNPKYNKAECVVVLNDDDMPEIELTITPNAVSEADGPGCIAAKIVRKTLVNNAVTIKLSDDGNGDMYYSQQTINLPAGAKEANFSIGVRDNQQVEGDRVVNITAGVYAASCGCAMSGTVTGASTVALTIRDNDGPTLNVKSSRSNLLEGATYATTLRVTRNNGTTGTTTVTITSDQDGDLTYEHTATIPDGQDYVEIPVGVKKNSIPDDERTVVFTVSADGFTSGSCWALITDQSMPDGTISGITVSPAAVASLGKATISIDLANGGNEPLATNAPITVYVSRDYERIPIATLYNQQAVGVDEVLTVSETVTMPELTGFWKLYAVLNEDHSVKELVYNNNTSSETDLHLLPPYTATVKVERKSYSQKETAVNLTGKVSGSKISNVPVEVYFILDGVRDTMEVTTDATGNFKLAFNPKGVGGHYVVGACFPGEKLSDEQDYFNVYGLRRTVAKVRRYEPMVGTPFNDEFSITNSCPLTQTNITAEVVSDNPDIEFSCQPIAKLDGNGEAMLNFTILPKEASAGDQWYSLRLNIKSAEGASFETTFYYYNRTPKGKLRSNITRIDATMTKGASRDYPIEITNIGMGETGRISLSLPNVPWLSAVTPIDMPSMATKDTTTIILRFTPTDDMQLNVPQTGVIGINIENGDGIPLSYSVEPVSESTGTLIVDVTDEYTYFTDEAPHLAGAHVKLSHPTTGKVIAEGESDANGHFTVNDLPEGYYNLYVTADKHDGYRNNIMVNPGRENLETVVLKYQAISVSWDVVETEVEDEYKIVTTLVYETNVPVPVVTVRGPDDITAIQKLEVGESMLFYYAYTNEGLITADNFDMEQIGNEEGISGNFKYEIINAPPSQLAPQQQWLACLKVTRVSKNTAGAPMRRDESGGSKMNCIQSLVAIYTYMCHMNDTQSGVAKNLQIDTDCGKLLQGGGGSASGGYLPPSNNPGTGVWGHDNGDGIGGGGGWCPSHAQQLIRASHNLLRIAVITTLKYVPGGKGLTWAYEQGQKAEKTWNEWSDYGKDCWTKLTNKKDKMRLANFLTTVYTKNPLRKEIDEKIFGFHVPETMEDYEELSTKVIKDGIKDMVKDEEKAGKICDGLDEVMNLVNTAQSVSESLDDLEAWRAGNPPQAQRECEGHYGSDVPRSQIKHETQRKVDEPYPAPLAMLCDALIYMQCQLDNKMYFVEEMFGSPKWISATCGEMYKFCTAVNYVLEQDRPIEFDDVWAVKPLCISQEELDRCIERLNNSMTFSDAENQINFDRLYKFCDNIGYVTSCAVNRGYETVARFFDASYSAVQAYEEHGNKSNSVCASVTLQINQTMTMTRQAFRGTLTVENNSSAGEMKDVKLKIEVTDVDGNVATAHEFAIAAENLTGFEGETSLDANWTLAQDAKGVATILFIPTKYAAETHDKVYYFGGSLSYIDPATELTVTRDLTPVPLTVKPSPNLNLTYFMQRDIFGDDPQTERIEPVVPAEFALLIENEGYGDATNVKMVTDQPKVVENEKGLLVDFVFTSSQLNGQEKVLSLGQSIPTNFGTIPSRSTMYAQWWLECSLLGHFTAYNVEATHVTSYGNEDLSLLNNVTIHELIHSIDIESPTGDMLKGWLVNDVVDYNEYPDNLYLSDATTERVYEARYAELTKNSDTEYVLRVKPDNFGWNYGNVFDPTGGKRVVESVVRADGTVIAARNIWTTDRTLVDGTDPIYENRLHFVDKFLTLDETTYTITFSERPELPLFVSNVEGLPEVARDELYIGTTGDITVTYNKPVDETTLKDNISLVCQAKVVEEKPTITKVDDQTFILRWATATLQSGYFTLTNYCSRMLDMEGFHGDYDHKVSWNQMTDGKVALTLRATPPSGGTVSPASGTYDYGSNVVITATPNSNYNFKCWEKDNEVYSTNATASVTVTGNTGLIAVFTPKKVDVTVESGGDGGTVNGGTGTYDYGETVTLTAEPQPGYTFVGWNVNGSIASTEPTYTFTVDGKTVVTPIFEPVPVTVTNSYQFTTGWNWFSLNPADKSLLDVQTLLAQLGGSALEIRGSNGTLKYENGEWTGDLTTLNSDETYQILMSEPKTLDVTQNSTTTRGLIMLNKGWNKVAYLPFEELDVAIALGGWDAQRNDMVVGQDEFAVFDGTEWKGTLKTMSPGFGYKMYSQVTTSFRYPTTVVDSDILNVADFDDESQDTGARYHKASVREGSLPEMTVMSRQYADNMPIIANVLKNEVIVNADTYTIGAFVDDELRGVSELLDNQYFIIVYGNNTEQVKYDVYDGGKNSFVITEGDAIFAADELPLLDLPTEVVIKEVATDISTVQTAGAGMSIWPARVQDRIYVRGVTGEVTYVAVTSISGKLCIESDHLDADNSLDVSQIARGVYIISVRDKSGALNRKFIKL